MGAQSIFSAGQVPSPFRPWPAKPASGTSPSGQAGSQTHSAVPKFIPGTRAGGLRTSASPTASIPASMSRVTGAAFPHSTTAPGQSMLPTLPFLPGDSALVTSKTPMLSPGPPRASVQAVKPGGRPLPVASTSKPAVHPNAVTGGPQAQSTTRANRPVALLNKEAQMHKAHKRLEDAIEKKTRQVNAATPDDRKKLDANVATARQTYELYRRTWQKAEQDYRRGYKQTVRANSRPLEIASRGAEATASMSRLKRT